MHIGATHAAQGEHKEAVESFKTALVVGDAVRGEGWEGKAECLKLLGQCQTTMSDPAAIHTFELALGLWKEKGNRAGEASILMKMAESHIKLKKLDKALDQVEQSLELRRAVGDWRGQAECLYQLGTIHRLLNDLTAAREAYEQCIEMRKEGKDMYGLADSMSAMGQVLATQGRPDEGLHRHAAALEIRRQLSDTVGIAESILKSTRYCEFL
jgi:tetratricopeptide (TPR) repeat protein